MSDHCRQTCINPDCAATYDVSEPLFACKACGDLLDIQYDWDALAVPKSMSDFADRWARRDNPLNFSGVWRFRDLLPFCDESMCQTVGEGQTILQRKRSGRGIRPLRPRQCVPAIRRHEPFGLVQGQRYDRGHQSRQNGRGRSCDLRLNGQYFGLGGPVRPRGQYEMFGLHRLGPHRLRQTQSGPGLRCPHDPDPGRFRRLHASRAGSLQRSGPVPDELAEPLPPGRPENNHVPHHRGIELGGARLDHRARRESGQTAVRSARRSWN